MSTDSHDDERVCDVGEREEEVNVRDLHLFPVQRYVGDMRSDECEHATGSAADVGC